MKSMLALLAASLPLVALADEAAIRQNLTERYPQLSIKSVNPTPIAGLYEVYAGGQLLYADEKADHLLMGPLVDTRSRLNLSQARLEVLSTVNFAGLPFDKAITLVKGKGERHIAVFSDPDCPYCKRLEQELATLDNLTVHLFLLPLPELHPQAVDVARDVWCAADRAAAWRGYMLDGKRPAAAQCANPVEAVAELARELGIHGTPAMVLPNGRRIDGAVPAARLESLLGGS